MDSDRARSTVITHPTDGHVEACCRDERNEHPATLYGSDDADKMIDELSAAPVGYDLAVLYSTSRPMSPRGNPDNQFYVGIKGRLNIGVMRFSDNDGSRVTFQPDKRLAAASSESIDGHVRYALNGHACEFPRGSEIPIDLIRRALKEFCSNGGRRPTSVQWQPDI